ncbi:MAG TPA: hydrogenase nickel incorporation protein HypB [Burkholderiales bacterium]|nr:hydrogenase nickel incorporation protein HypB [Burkholderiales bacterium]
MCKTCGCEVTPGNAHLAYRPVRQHTTAVDVLGRLLAANDHAAEHNRAHFDDHGVLALNLMSAPGSGKTALIEATADALGRELRLGVLVGDLATDNDAERIRTHGIPAVQITTGEACHLDAHMIHDALHQMALDGLDVLFIENVGNLVCPASFDLGQHRNVALLSFTEGDDKPAKYPVLFRSADLVLLTKSDLARHMEDFDAARAEGCLRALANAAPLHALSARRGINLHPWFDWVRGELAAVRARRRAAFHPGAHHHDHGEGLAR